MKGLHCCDTIPMILMQQQQVIFTRPKKVTVDSFSSNNRKENHLIDKPDASERQQTVKEHSKKFKMLFEKRDKILIKIKTVFPFKLFTDIIIVDENKVDIIEGIFFFSEKIKSIPISNIQDVEVETSIFFAVIKILQVGYMEEWIIIRYLWKNDAKRTRDIISGLLIGNNNGIDFTKVKTKNLAKEIENLGKVN